MNLTNSQQVVVDDALEEHALFSKMALLIEACEHSENMMVGIYLLEKRQFLFCNLKLKELLGGCSDLLCDKGWDFWYSLIDPKDVSRIKKAISNFVMLPYVQDVLTLKYHITHKLGKKMFIRHELLIHQIEQRLLAINYIFDVSDKEKIEHCFQSPINVKSRCFSKQVAPIISPREKQVLQLIADGFSSKEIADILFISNHTAVSHRKNLIEKFQVKNTAHLVKRALPLLQ